MSLSCCHDGHFITMIYKWIICENGCGLNHAPCRKRTILLGQFHDMSSYSWQNLYCKRYPSSRKNQLTFNTHLTSKCVFRTPFNLGSDFFFWGIALLLAACPIFLSFCFKKEAINNKLIPQYLTYGNRASIFHKKRMSSGEQVKMAQFHQFCASTRGR